MNHQNGRKKLNMKSAHRKALLRNQTIHFIKYGFLQTTKAKIKEVQRFAEKIVTVSREGYNFNTIRRVQQILPYDAAAVKKLIQEIAPKYINRPGGYTRVIPLGKRPSDTATIARLEWV
jgi:large subunit ribosomal protein L17